MEISQLAGYGIPTWGPSRKCRGLLAAGTFSGSQEQDSLLRIGKYDINNTSGLALQGVTQSPAKFASLDWVDFKDDYGIIAGGMDDGAITLWDPKKILDGQSTMDNLKMGKGCVSATKIHNGVPVGSIEFNPHKKNLVASGGSEVLIQDISANLKAPNVFKPGVPNYHEGSRITAISWNRIVPHILASASENGKIVVWDLKVNKSIFNFTEPSSSSGGMDDFFGGQDQQHSQNTPMKETQMMWNPEIPTQFVVANDDDQSPSINIWDLRKPDYPVATFNDIHYSGILSFSWCLSDPSLVISSGKDNRTVVTNFKTGEQVLEFPTQTSYKKIKWSGNLHGKICAMNDEGACSILSFEPEGLFSNPGRPYATPNISQQTNEPFMPKWVQPRCGARFGFGNKLVSFDQKSRGLVTVHQKGTNFDLAKRVQDFDQDLESIPMSQICEIKSRNAENDYDMMEFKVLKCLLENNFDDLLKQFGIDKNKAAFEAERYLGRKLNRPQENQQQLPQKPVQNSMMQSNLPSMTAEGAADFFSQLGQKDTSQKNQASDKLQDGASGGNSHMHPAGSGSGADNDGSSGARAPNSRQNFVQETISRNTNWDEGAEGIIKQNLLLGELECAAQVALKCGRTTQALLIAEAGGKELYEQIKEEYFASHKDVFVKEVVQAIVKDDFAGIIEHVSKQQLQEPQFCTWKETLAYIIAYEDDVKLKEVAKQLGDQLLNSKKDINSAIVCYILANEVAIVTDLWKKRALYQIRKLGLDKNEALFHLLQKTIILRAACKSTEPNADFDLILADFGQFLNAEQLSFFSVKYLLNSSMSHPDVQNIMHRIFYSHTQLVQNFPKPQPAFAVEQIRIQVNPNQVAQQLTGQVAQAAQQQRGPHKNPRAGPGGAVNQAQAQRPGPAGPGQSQRYAPHPPNTQQRTPAIPQYQTAGPQHPGQPPMRGPPQDSRLQMGQGTASGQMGQSQPPVGQFNQMNLQGGGNTVIPPRQPPNLDDSLHANYGYKESTKRAAMLAQNAAARNTQPQASPGTQQIPAKPTTSQRPAQPQPTSGSSTTALRPGPMGPGGPAGPSMQHAGNQGPKGAPLPSKRPAMPAMPAPLPSTGPQGVGRPGGAMSSFNPAEVQQQQQPHAPNQPMSGPPGQAPPRTAQQQAVRPPPIQRAPPMQPASAPHQQAPNHGMAQGGPPQAAPQKQPPMPAMQNPNAPSMRAPQGGPPPMRQPQKFAPPPMGVGQQPPMPQNPSQPQQQPPMAPPMGGGGPRPMTAGLAPPQRGPQAPPTGGSAGGQPSSGAEPQVDMADLVNRFQALFGLYTQLETNQKLRGETESKFNLMMDRVRAGQLQPTTLQKLSTVVSLIEQNNGQGSQAAFRDLTQRCWPDVKDFSNAVKVLASFKQKYQH